MEKTTNNYYKAVSILCYIFGAIAIISGIWIIVASAIPSSLLYQEIFSESLADFGGDVELTVEYTKTVLRVLIVMGVFIALSSSVLFVEGVVFGKLVNLSNKEADEQYNKALTWSIISFFFGGILIGGLALGGLLGTQNQQRIKYYNEKEMPVVTEVSQEKSKQSISLDKIDRANERLHKLEELKKANAISEEEYNAIRDQIVKTLIPEEKTDKVEEQTEIKVDKQEKINSRIEKLEKLKASGAISEDEFEVLKSKVQEENK